MIFSFSNCNVLLKSILIKFGITSDEDLYFHGTSWDGALSIMSEIEIIPRSKAKDFGKKNFYVINSFKSSCIWAKRKNQSAIVVFNITKEYIEVLDNHISLNNEDEWKETVFKMRNPPPGGSIYVREKRNYNNFVIKYDSSDLVTGPIFANPKCKSLDQVKYIEYDKEIPIQYAFKESTINDLNSMKAFVIFFEEY